MDDIDLESYWYALKPPPKLTFGWFSESALNFNGFYVYYLRPDGTEVLVTLVNQSDSDSGSLWHDIQCVGEVVTYVRSGGWDRCSKQ